MTPVVSQKIAMHLVGAVKCRDYHGWDCKTTGDGNVYTLSDGKAKLTALVPYSCTKFPRQHIFIEVAEYEESVELADIFDQSLIIKHDGQIDTLDIEGAVE